MDLETTKNLMIERDNLEVLKLLQKSYAGSVKMIYIDLPVAVIRSRRSWRVAKVVGICRKRQAGICRKMVPRRPFPIEVALNA